MQNKSFRRLFILCLTLTIPATLFALPSDKTEPATISSNSADYNQKTGISIFTGNVVIIQGTTKITAAQITTYNGPKQQLSKAIAIGSKNKPAIYQTIPKKGDAVFTASANRIEYLPPQNEVLLIGNGKLQQKNNILSSDYIIYNQKTGELKTKHIGTSRTTIVLESAEKSGPSITNQK